MAQLVAEVAARSAAHTAKSVATDRMQALTLAQQGKP
jgi:hypothetical protein